MQLVGMGVYGPVLPCCASAEAAAASAAETGAACDSNCIDPNPELTTQQAAIDRIAQAVQDLQVAEYQRTQEATGTTSTQWFSGVSNTAVVLVGVGLGAIMLWKGSR